MAARFRLVPAEVAEQGVIRVEPEGVGGQVPLLRAHLVDVACHELP